MTDLKSRILAEVAPDLAVIEEELRRQLKPQLELVGEVAGHILFAGGKRLRPLLLVLAARLCGYRGDYAATFSVSLEYLHAATLIHDDLVDGSPMRRGREAAHRIYGPATAVLVGDFLLARALSLAAGTGNIAIIEVVAAITENMSQGEIHQLARKGDLNLTEAEYRQVIWRKTAVLFEGACKVAALLAGAPPREVEALAAYGTHLGMAFQMADDLIDYLSDTRELGKRAGADLREGKLTLPVIAALHAAPAADRKRMAAIIANPDFAPRDFDELLSLLHTHGGIHYAREQAGAHIRQAKAALEVFDPSPTRDLLRDVADYTLSRRA